MLDNVDYILNSTKKMSEYISSITKSICAKGILDSINNINNLLAMNLPKNIGHIFIEFYRK